MFDPVVMSGLYGSPGAKVQQTAFNPYFVVKSELFIAQWRKLPKF
jgi:hypothetical protein